MLDACISTRRGRAQETDRPRSSYGTFMAHKSVKPWSPGSASVKQTSTKTADRKRSVRVSVALIIRRSRVQAPAAPLPGSSVTEGNSKPRHRRRPFMYCGWCPPSPRLRTTHEQLIVREPSSGIPRARKRARHQCRRSHSGRQKRRQRSLRRLARVASAARSAGVQPPRRDVRCGTS